MFVMCLFYCLHQGSRQQRQRDTARKSEGVSGAAQGPSTLADNNSERTVTGGSRKGDTANENDQPREQRPKDASARKPKDNKDTEKARVNVSSREFVRGGRGRLRGGSARGRARGGYQDVHGSTSHGEVESVNQRGSADDVTKTQGRTDAQHSKMEDRKSSHEALVGSQQIRKVDAKSQPNDRVTVQSPSDDRGNKAQGLLHSNTGNNLAKHTGRWGESPAQSGRRRMEFYDSRNRGQKMRQSDTRANNAGKPQQRPHTAPVKDGADAEKNATASGLDITDTSSNKCLNEATTEQTSQRKPGEH